MNFSVLNLCPLKYWLQWNVCSVWVRFQSTWKCLFSGKGSLQLHRQALQAADWREEVQRAAVMEGEELAGEGAGPKSREGRGLHKAGWCHCERRAPTWLVSYRCSQHLARALHFCECCDIQSFNSIHHCCKIVTDSVKAPEHECFNSVQLQTKTTYLINQTCSMTY